MTRAEGVSALNVIQTYKKLNVLFAQLTCVMFEQFISLYSNFLTAGMTLALCKVSSPRAKHSYLLSSSPL